MITSKMAADSLKVDCGQILIPVVEAGHVIQALGGVMTVTQEAEWSVSSNGHTYSVKVVAGTDANGNKEGHWRCNCPQGQSYAPTAPDGFLWLGGRICKHVAAAAIQWMVGGSEPGNPADLFEATRRVIAAEAVYCTPGSPYKFYKKLALLVDEAGQLSLRWGRAQSGLITGPDGVLKDEARLVYDEFVAKVKEYEAGLKDD